MVSKSFAASRDLQSSSNQPQTTTTSEVFSSNSPVILFYILLNFLQAGHLTLEKYNMEAPFGKSFKLDRRAQPLPLYMYMPCSISCETDSYVFSFTVVLHDLNYYPSTLIIISKYQIYDRKYNRYCLLRDNTISHLENENPLPGNHH